jgi:PAS domain S-box-containing protein
LIPDSLSTLAIDASPNAVAVVDADGIILGVNPAFERQFGYSRDEAIGRPFIGVIGDRLRPSPARQALLARCKDGTTVAAKVSVSDLDTPGGRCNVVWFDDGDAFQERLAFERLVTDLSATFVSIDAAQVDAAIVDAQRRIVEVLDMDRSTIFQRQDEAQEFVRTHSWSRTSESERARPSPGRLFPAAFARVARGESVAFSTVDDIDDPADREAIRALGTKSGIGIPLRVGARVAGVITFGSLRREYEWSYAVRGRLELIAQVFASALGRKRADAALQASEERFRRLADAAPVMIWVAGLDKGCVWLNRQWIAFTGRPLAEQLDGGWLGAVHPDDAEACMRSYSTAFDSRATFAMQYRLRRYDGVYRWVFDRGAPEYDANGSFQGYVGSCIDVTDERESKTRLEHALADLGKAHDGLSAQLDRLELVHGITRAVVGREDLGSMFQVVLRSIEDHLGCDFGCICDFDDAAQVVQVTHVGPKSETVAPSLAVDAQRQIPLAGTPFGPCASGRLVYEPDVLTSESPSARFAGTTGLRSWVAAPLQAADTISGLLLVARRPAHAFTDGDREFLHRLSEHVAVAARQTQLYTDLQRAYDDLQSTQHALIDQERLHVLGQMASGIAHDINNALGPVSLYATTIRKTEPSLSAEAREYLAIMERSVRDVAQTVDRLREFSRRPDAAFAAAPVDVRNVLEQVKTITRARWKDIPLQRGIVVQLRTEIAPAVPPILGDEPEIRGALVNLVFNAIDAMPNGGTITLRGVAVDGRVVLEVADTGVGMTDDIRRRCLEPFFTTKGDRGTGLGLAMVYGAVQRHRGDIDITSGVGEGTRIRLTFPAAPRVAEPHSGAADGTGALPPLRVLVIDDDIRLLKSLRDVLEHEGHAVIIASNGRVGIDAFRDAQAAGAAFDVVVTDLAMPDVDGRKVAAAIKRVSATPVILLTGWGQQVIADELPAHVDRVLCKPPRLQEIRDALWSCCSNS